tara:strand:- start:346 stop:549 length:204 start_codon:yes stop_codon:yes gene_type:complete
MKCTKTVKGTELKVNDIRSIGWKQTSTIKSVSHGQLEAGARYQDVTTEDGNTERCWEGFSYSVLVEA